MKYAKSLIILLVATLLNCSKGSETPSPSPTPTPGSGLTLIQDNAITCRVVCPAGSNAEATKAANAICNKLKALSQKSLSVEKSSAGDDAIEVIVGAGAYNGAEKDYRSFTYGTYLTKISGNKLIVAAHDSASYAAASSALLTALGRQYSNGTLTMTSSALPKPATPAVNGFIPPYVTSAALPAYILQTGSVTPDDSAMQVAYKSLSFNDFTAYCASLEAIGYRKVSENNMLANRYASYSNGTYLVSVSFYGSTTKLMNIVSEKDYSKSLWSISGTPGTVKPLMMQVYQDNVVYTSSHPGCHVVRLSDGRYFIFDTGDTKIADQIMGYMRSRNTFTDGKVHIALIIISHPHSDHMNGLFELADKYKSEIVCEAVAYNMTNHTRQSEYSLSTLHGRQNKIYNAGKALGAECYCLRSGQKLDLAGASLEVLFTPDELGTFFLSGKNPAGETDTKYDQNNSSNMARLTVDGQQITFTGDCRGGEAEIFNEMVKPVFTSSIMTVAHHGFNVAATVQMYHKAQPFVLFWTIRKDEQDTSRYFDKQLMSATYVKKHFFEETMAEIELPYKL